MTPPSLIKYVVWKKKKDSVLFSPFGLEFTWDFFAFWHAESVWILRRKKCIINSDIGEDRAMQGCNSSALYLAYTKVYIKKGVGFPPFFYAYLRLFINCHLTANQSVYVCYKRSLIWLNKAILSTF